MIYSSCEIVLESLNKKFQSENAKSKKERILKKAGKRENYTDDKKVFIVWRFQ
ncbi:hypothetical protein ME7_01256 [Bartonella birtlesii LL-WM9]|uniref:Uncharacterized protein n=1 Tax=Bartonella birtlesii LL-WM9 TaxID=1094552 RepID=J1IUQ2_9HYPH|nr:hypothetical protein ME7_01256 [Bartonella birtlesii LL-WM9]